MKKNKIAFLFLIIITFGYQASTMAQCAMCKTGVESDLKNGGSIGSNLNTGILYLMTVPYIILGLGGYFFFRKEINAKLKAWKKKRFPSRQVN